MTYADALAAENAAEKASELCRDLLDTNINISLDTMGQPAQQERNLMLVDNESAQQAMIDQRDSVDATILGYKKSDLLHQVLQRLGMCGGCIISADKLLIPVI